MAEDKIKNVELHLVLFSIYRVGQKKRSKFETRPFKIYTFVLIQQTHEENAVLRVLANVSFQRGELGNEGNGDYTGEGATGDPTNEQTEGVETC